MAQPADRCIFCQILGGERPAYRVLEDPVAVAFLDHRPLLPGHCLLVPRQHVETLHDLPLALVGPLFRDVQLLARAVERGMAADGAFTAINVKVSQSVPHLHVHVLPRWRKDGLFSYKMVWKRQPYPDEAAKADAQRRIRRALEELVR